MELRHAMLMLVAASVVAWGASPALFEYPALAVGGAVAIALIALMMRAAAWTCCDEPTAYSRSLLATLVCAAIVPVSPAVSIVACVPVVAIAFRVTAARALAITLLSCVWTMGLTITLLPLVLAGAALAH